MTQPVIAELTALKQTLVITTGDNYVGAAEPQLREKLVTLYSKVAGGYAPPSSSEMQNLQLLEDRFNQARADFEKIKAKRVNKMNSFMEKSGIAPVEMKTFADFLGE